MLKKLASLLLSLLLCLSLLPGQARTADLTAEAPTVQMEASEPAHPDDPVVMVCVEDLPAEEDTRASGD